MSANDNQKPSDKSEGVAGIGCTDGSGHGFRVRLPRAATRFGPYLSKSRKRRRHRIRQWRSKWDRDIEANVIDSITVERDKDTGLDLMITKSHDKRTGVKKQMVQVA